MMSIKSRKPKLVAVVGPNASGKSALSVTLAKRFNGEVISADSRQVYRGMNLGTGKITKREMQGVPHYLLDVVSPKKIFTAVQYQKLGRAAIEKILAKHKAPIVVGGTGLYIDALLYRYALPVARPNPALRRKLEKKSNEALFRRLKMLDPRRASNIDRHNKRRLIRALEIIAFTKRPVPAASESLKKESDYDVLKIGLLLPRKKLQKNIADRWSKRLRQGMMREVTLLHKKSGLSWQRLDSFGLEYRYIARHLRGLITKEQMAETIRHESYRYAKRQMTWFRKDKTIRWIKNPRQAPGLVKHFFR
jgi:tRNA dimethylallyltransferase